MNAKHSFRNWMAVSLLGLLTLALFAGCPGDGGTTNPPSGIDTEERLIVQNGKQPVWIDVNRFLFNYDSDTGNDGIYMSDLDGSITELYGDVHNHDYVVSPSGTYAAFSTPDLIGGIYIVELANPDPTLILTGAKHPSFLTDDMLVVEADDGTFGMVEASNPGVYTEYGVGANPVASADGDFVAFTYNVAGSGFQVQIYDRNEDEIIPLVSNVGVDHVWHPDGSTVYVSQLIDGTLTDVIEIPVANPNGYTTLMKGATRPSVSNDGVHMFADKVTNGELNGILYHKLTSGREEAIFSAQQPAAAFTDTALLAEKSQGIYYITFE